MSGIIPTYRTGHTKTTERKPPATVAPTAATAGTVRVRLFGGTTATGTALFDRTATITAGDWALTVLEADQLADGTYTARFEQADTAGNAETIDRTFKVDATAPEAAITAPADGDRTNDTTPAVSGTAGSAAGTATS